MKFMFDEEAALRSHEEEIRQEVTEKVTEKVTEEVTEKVTEKGIRALIATVKKFSHNRDMAIQTLMEQFGLLPQIAADKVSLYWG